MKEWLAWMKKYYPAGNITDANNTYGYGVAYLMVAVLKACGDNLTRENVMKAGGEPPHSEGAVVASRDHHLDQRHRLRADQADADDEV